MPQQHSASQVLRPRRWAVFVASAWFLGSIALSPARADEAKTYGEAFSVPVFETVDKNGVDLATGMLRITSPVIQRGTEEAPEREGLQWMGRGWLHIERPTIWRKDGVFTVNALGRSEEFKDHNSNYAQKKPLTGSTLSCSVYDPSNIASYCIYTNHDGDIIEFSGIYAPSTPYPESYGPSSYAWGNLGMREAVLSSTDRQSRRWGTRQIGGFAEYGYNNRIWTLTLGNQSLKIVTPNHDGTDIDEHYLRPKDTVQSIVDDNGSTWSYTINGDREMTRIDAPGTAADVTIAYYGNHKVKSVTNVDGVWNYVYANNFGYGTTTVTGPTGEQTYVKWDLDKNFVLEARDGLNRPTYYHYDSGDRLDRVTYPEGNSVEFQYDARGNIKQRTTMPKPGMGSPIIETANFDETCADTVLCNRPHYMIGANGERTDFEYKPTIQVNLYPWPTSIGPPASRAGGTGRPVKITMPAAAPDKPHPQIRNTYTGGLLSESHMCRTQATCEGTSDEVVTKYYYSQSSTVYRMLFGKEVIADGVTIRTCATFDDQGRKVSETSGKGAAAASCPYSVVTAPAANAVAPATPNPVSAPTYPDTAAAPPGSGGPPNDPPPGGPQP